MIRNKKGQEEMVGFVIIMVIVAVIGLFFVFILVRQPKQYPPSSEIESFIQASMLYTSSCSYSDNSEPYNLQYLAEACSKQEKCFDGQDSCVVFNNTFSHLVEASFNINPESVYKGYKFELVEGSDIILSSKKGSLAGSVYGARIPFSTTSGTMNFTLNLYF